MLSTPAGAYVKVSAGYTNSCAIHAVDFVIVCWGNNTRGESTPPGSVTTRVAPVATVSAPASVVALDTIRVTVTNARVPGYPQVTSFTYQFDCGDGKGFGAPMPVSSAKCPTRVAGTRTVRAKVIDPDGDGWSNGVNVTVTLRPQTVTFTSLPNAPTMGSTSTVIAKAASGLPVAISASPSTICSSSASDVTFADIGTCTIAADVAGDSTYVCTGASERQRRLAVLRVRWRTEPTVRREPGYGRSLCGDPLRPRR